MIVRALQKKDNVVAMTGDGINDAPSIRTADIGIAMGVSGTDVTKSASDMVITDDNFTTIVTAVREGRRVFSNIKKTIQFFLATNLAEVLCILAVTLVLYRFDFLTSTQLLWINLITDSLPVLALGAEGADRDVMERPPRRASEIFAAPSVVSMLFFGALQAIIVILAFIYCVNAYGNAVAVTVTFFVLSFLELFHSFNIRSDVESTFGKGFSSNKMMFLTVFIGIAVNMILCFVPVFRAAFGIVQLTTIQWLFVPFSPRSICSYGAREASPSRSGSTTNGKSRRRPGEHFQKFGAHAAVHLRLRVGRLAASDALGDVRRHPAEFAQTRRKFLCRRSFYTVISVGRGRDRGQDAVFIQK